MNELTLTNVNRLSIEVLWEEYAPGKNRPLIFIQGLGFESTVTKVEGGQPQEFVTSLKEKPIVGISYAPRDIEGLLAILGRAATKLAFPLEEVHQKSAWTPSENPNKPEPQTPDSTPA